MLSLLSFIYSSPFHNSYPPVTCVFSFLSSTPYLDSVFLISSLLILYLLPSLYSSICSPVLSPVSVTYFLFLFYFPAFYCLHFAPTFPFSLIFYFSASYFFFSTFSFPMSFSLAYVFFCLANDNPPFHFAFLCLAAPLLFSSLFSSLPLP